MMLGPIIEVGRASADLWVMFGSIIEVGRVSADLWTMMGVLFGQRPASVHPTKLKA